VHIDIHTDDPAAEVARLEDLGAERVLQVHSWWVLRDPAGLLFCVIPEPAGSLNEAMRNAGTDAVQQAVAGHTDTHRYCAVTVMD
jgi:hypothetical protein